MRRQIKKFFLLIVLPLPLLTITLPIFISNTVNAAPPVDAQIVPFNGQSSVNCYAQINNASTTTNQYVPRTIDGVEQYPDEAASTFSAVSHLGTSTGQNLATVTFKSENSNSSPSCSRSLGFYQSKVDPTVFYGGWSIEVSTQLSSYHTIFIKGKVNTTNQTISFTLPDEKNLQANKVNGSGSYTLKLNGFSGLNKSVFPSGSGGNCLEKASNDSDLKGCVSKIGNTAKWVDAATITYNGDTYTAKKWGGDSNPYGNGNAIKYYLTNPVDGDRLISGKTPEIDLNTDNANTDLNIDANSTAQLNDVVKSLKYAAQGHEIPVYFTNYDSNGNKSFYNNLNVQSSNLNKFAQYWPKGTTSTATPDSVTLVFADGGGNEDNFIGTYTRKGGSNIFTYTSGGSKDCAANRPNIVFKSDPASATPGSSVNATWSMITGNDNSACDYADDALIQVIIHNASDQAPAAPQEDTSDSAPEFNCSVNFYNPLTWILCPIATLMVDLSQTFDNAINSFLCIEPDTSDKSLGLSSCDTNPLKTDGKADAGSIGAYKSAWAAMRDISLAFVVIIGLLAIISQASSVAIFDAYTIKKTMPRLLFAAIGVAVSWPLLNWFIQLTNDLGFGVRVLIYTPFKDSLVSLGQGTSFLATIFGGGGFVALLGIGGLISFAATAALFGAVAFLILTIRQIAIIGLVIFAPVAIMLYAAPFGQKLAARWWQEFMQLTMAFPLVAGAIAIGHVFGAIGTQGQNAIGQLLGLTAYFAGEVATVGILLKRGAILGAAGGAIQKQASKGYGALSKRRGARAADRWKRARSGGIWQPDSGKFTLPKSGLLPGRLRGKQLSIGNIGNSLAARTLDGEELFGSFLGKKGVPGLKGYTRKAESKIAHERSHHIAKAAQDFGHFQHHTKRLISGGYDSIDDPKLKQKIREAGLVDQRGNLRAPNTGAEITKLADVMQGHDDIKWRSTANELRAAAGFAESFHSGENNRAGKHLDLVAATALAADGRLSGQDMTRLLNKHHGTVLGTEMHGIMAQASQKRPDLRIGHGVMEGADGHMAYVFDKDAYDNDASVKKAARENVLSMDTGMLYGAKGEMFSDKGFQEITKEILNGKYLEEAKGDKVEYEKRQIETKQLQAKFFAAAGPYGQNASDAQAAMVSLFEGDVLDTYKRQSGSGSYTDAAEHAEAARLQQIQAQAGDNAPPPGTTPPIISG